MVKIKEAPAESFAVGEFALITEAIPGAEVTPMPVRDPAAVHVAPRQRSAAGGALPPSLVPCRSCAGYIWPHEITCPHCEADVAEARATYDEDSQRRRALIAEATRVFAKLGVTAGAEA